MSGANLSSEEESSLVTSFGEDIELVEEWSP